MLSTRGAVLALGAACGAIAGLAYGVEEFVFLALSVVVLLVLGAVSAWYRQHVSRRGLRLVVKVPSAEVTARQSASVELTVTNAGAASTAAGAGRGARAATGPCHHPGLGESSTARGPGRPGPSPDAAHGPSAPPPLAAFTALGRALVAGRVAGWPRNAARADASAPGTGGPWPAAAAASRPRSR